jgi:hypothetical protein
MHGIAAPPLLPLGAAVAAHTAGWGRSRIEYTQGVILNYCTRGSLSILNRGVCGTEY